MTTLECYWDNFKKFHFRMNVIHKTNAILKAISTAQIQTVYMVNQLSIGSLRVNDVDP